ncbi:hypothetical protein Tco_1121408 [Tanacetum coccineum]|uniref:Reverse transcriptase domain-containing protein n=1 Tax=Tanacetum coccineum TaxID=301880 RepID=A0ABQ5J089_9ASTR
MLFNKIFHYIQAPILNPTDPHHTPTFIQPSISQPQKKQRPRKPKRKDTEIPQSSGPTDNIADEAVNEEMDDNLEKAATNDTSLDAEQDRGNINTTQSKATPNEAGSQGTTSSGGPRCQDTMGDTIAQTRFENVSKTSNDPLLARGNTLRSGEDSLKLNELMELCINLQQRVLNLDTIKTTQANEIASLKRRVKNLKRRNKSRTHGLKRIYRVGSSRRVESSKDEGLGEEDVSKQGRIADIDANKDIYLVNVHTDEDMFSVNDLDGDEVIANNVDVVKTVEETRSVVEQFTAVIEKAKLVSTAKETINAAAITVSTASTIPDTATITTTTTTATITDVEITLAQALAELKSAKPKADKVVIQEPEQGTTTTTPTTIISIPKPLQDKGKWIMIEEPVVEQVKPMKRLEQIRLDEELVFKLQAEEEERLAREKAYQTEEANIVWDDIQAKIKADYQLAQRLQAQEQKELTDEEKARLFVQFLDQRRKHFAAKRAEEKRNRPPTRAQQRSIKCTYLKNMEGWMPKSLKNKSFANIQELFDKAMKKVNTFVDYKTDLVEESSKKAEAEIAQESSSKRAGDELEQENAKKQKVDEDKETTELQSLIEVVSDDEEEVAIDAVPLASKPPTIIDWKIHKEGKKSYYQIIRADGKSQMYKVFSQMLKSFSREDLEDLYKLVKAKYGLTRLVGDLDLIRTEPVNYMDNFLLLNLKTMFEHHVEDNV